MALLPLVDQRWFVLRSRSSLGDTSVSVVELAHGVVLGAGASSLKAALREACARPKNGKPRRPRVVVVATEADLAELKGAMPGVAVEVGPLPEHLTAAVQTNRQREKSSGPKRALGWSDELFGALFQLADDLFALAPWDIFTDTEWLEVRAPLQGVEEGVLIVLGDARQQYGFLFFPDPHSARRFAELAYQGSRSGRDPRRGTDFGEYFAFNLDEEHEVPPELVMAGRRFHFHGPRFPLPMRVIGTSAELASPLEASRLVALGSALCELMEERGDALEQGKPVSHTWEGITLSIGGGVAVGRGDGPPLDADAQWRADDFALLSRLKALADELLPGWLDEGGLELSDGEMRDALELWPILLSGPYRSSTPIAELRRLRPEVFEARVEAILAAQAVAWNGLWAVIAITRGQGFSARDLLTHEERFVRDVAASRSVRERTVLCARIVTVGETSWLSAADLVALVPRDADDGRLLACERLDLPKTEAVALPKVLAYGVQRALPQIWQEHREAVHARPLPDLRTPDGEVLVIVEDGYTLDGPDVEAALSAIPGMERPVEPHDSWTLRSGDGAFQRTTIERELQHWNASSLTLEQADRARAVLEKTFGSELLFLGRATQSFKHQGPTTSSSPNSPEMEKVMLTYKSGLNATWPDRPLPALEGKTPRQAMRTQKGRAKVERLIVELEYSEQASPPGERYDFDELRAAMGLPLARLHPGLPRP